MRVCRYKRRLHALWSYLRGTDNGEVVPNLRQKVLQGKQISQLLSNRFAYVGQVPGCSQNLLCAARNQIDRQWPAQAMQNSVEWCDMQTLSLILMPSCTAAIAAGIGHIQSPAADSNQPLATTDICTTHRPRVMRHIIVAS